MSDRCAGGVKLKLGKRCPVCDAGPGDQCAKASLRDFEERQALINALKMQEAAEEAHANCGECNGEDVPDLCPVCFPLFDDARIARRSVLAAVS